MNIIKLSALAMAFLTATAIAPAAAQEASPTGLDQAVEACLSHDNPYGPASLVTFVEDGYGDALVWLSDRDGDYWACNADMDGAIYAYAAVGGDLTSRAGEEIISSIQASYSGSNHLAAAAEFCRSMLGDDGYLVTYVGDGLGDVLAWVDDGESLFMCNASTDGGLWLFEKVSEPINGGLDVGEQEFWLDPYEYEA